MNVLFFLRKQKIFTFVFINRFVMIGKEIPSVRSQTGLHLCNLNL